MDIKEKAKELNLKISALFLALKRKDTPLAAKFFAGMTVAYALSPIDLVPDFIPVFGYLDDIILLPILIAISIKLIPNDIMADCEIKSEGMWKDRKVTRWYFSIPIIFIWILLIWMILSKILPIY